MAEIHHKLHLNAALTEVFRTITTRDFLRAFPAYGAKVTMRTVDLEDGARVAWRCVDGPKEWIGTDITFDLQRQGGETVLRFGHMNWREPSDFLAHCTTMWGKVLHGLKTRVETPDAEDVLI